MPHPIRQCPLNSKQALFLCLGSLCPVASEAGQWQYAIHVLGDIEPDAMPDIASQNTAMKACGSQSQWQRVIAMLEDGVLADLAR